MPEINYRETTEALGTTRSLRYSPCKGIINSAILHFPSGCNSLVEIFIYLKSNQILPTPVTGGGTTNTGIALDDTTQAFNVNIPVEHGDPIEVIIYNHDDSNEHTNTIVVLIEQGLTYTGA